MTEPRTSLFRVVLAAGIAAAIGNCAVAQIGALDKGHQLLLNSGLQIWGCDTGASSFTYSNLTGANMNAVMWSHGESDPGILSTGQKWGKWVDYTASPATALNGTEQAHYADLVAIQVGDEQQTDIESPGSLTTTWFQNARNGNHFNDRLLYINSFYINDDGAYATFIANANPDAISFDAYPFGTPAGIAPINWLGKAQQFRRHALGSYIGVNGNAARPYGLYLQTYSSVTEGRRDPGDLEMRWQQFSAWTLGYTFIDAFTVGGATSLFNGGSMSSPNQPRYNQFKETSRQSLNLGPALTRLISYSNGPAGGGTSIVRGRDPSGNLNPVPISWKDFSVNDAPPNQRYLTGVSAVNLGTKNNGQPGDVYVGFFNPLHASFGDPTGTTYFMITNALGAYLQDPTLLVSDTIQQITLDFNVGASGISSLQRLSRNTGLVEVLPLTHVSGDHFRYIFNLEGGTGDLFKYNDGSPFVGIEQPTDALYWDNDGIAASNNTANGAGLGGTGTWDTSATKWYNGATDGPWVPNKAAVLWGAAGTLTLSAPQSAESLQFKSNGYTVTGSTLTMSGSETSVDSGMSGTINSTLAGSVGINKTGAGTLVLGNASNTYTGGTTVSAGVLRASADGNLGASPGSFTAGNITLNGGTLRFGANFDISGNRGITLGVGGGTIDTLGFSTIHGYNSTDPNFDGGFRGDGDLTKLGSGTFFAAATTVGTNASWKGRLILKEGIWKIVASDGLPYNAPLADGLQADQVTLDGGTWQIGATFSVTNARRGVTVAAGGGTIDTQNFDFTWAGPWAGNVPNAMLNKIGSGTLRLNSSPMVGPSTYAGNLNVNGGFLHLDGGTAIGDLASINLADTASVGLGISTAGVTETIGSLSGGGANGGNVSLAANLVTGGNDKSTTFAGVISGAGILTKTGSGTMTVTGANTYIGATNVNGGTLRVNNASGSGTGSGAVNVNNGGTLGGTGSIYGAINVGNGGHLAPGASAGTLSTSSNVNLSTGSVLDYELASVTTLGGGINDLLSITGGLTLGSSLTLNIDAYQGDLANGTYKLITYTGGLTGNTSGWTVGSSNASGSHGYSFSTATPGEIQLIVSNAAPTWTGAVSANWSIGGNWSTASEPTGTVHVTFPTPVPATGATITLFSGEAAKSITFNDSYTLVNGNIVVFTGDIFVAVTKTAAFSTATLNGAVPLNKLGPGTLVLGSTANSYNGGTNINAGTLRVSSNGNLGDAGGPLAFNGGTLNTTASFSSARVLNVNAGGGTLDTNAGVTTTITGSTFGTPGHTFVKAGAGTLLLNQGSPRSGTSSIWLCDVTVTSGTFKVGNGGFDGFLPGYDPIAYAGLPPTVPTINLVSGTTLEFNHGVGGAGQYATHAVVVSGNGNVVISGPKTETFVANNTYTGSTTINSGSSLRIGWGGPLNTGGLGATAIANSGALTFSNDHDTTFPGSISGAGTLLKEYNGTLTLTGAAAHTGGTTIATGTLQVGNGGTTGSISGNIANNANLAFNRSNNLTHAGIISGTGSVEQRGTGTLVLSGSNTHSGGTVVSGGALQVSSDGNLGAAPGSFTAGNITLDGGTLRFGANFDINNNRGITLGAGGGAIDTQAFTNAAGYNATAGGFQGPGDLTKLGSGTFFAAATTGGANTTWTGRLILKEGTWKIVASDGLPYNVPVGDGLKADQVTLDGGTWQIGTDTWSPGQTLSVTNGRRGITVASGGGTIDTQSFNFTWAGPIAGSDTNAVLNKIGSGILRFTGVASASSYSGIVNINEGTLRLDNGNTMGSLATINLADVAGATLNVTGNQTIGSLAGGGTSGGNVTLSAITLSAGDNNKSTTYGGVISGPGGLTKTGSGTFKLTGSNSYSGFTTVAGGTLSVDGVIAGNAIVQNGATLAGVGTIGGTTTVQSGGILSPGNSQGTIHVGSLSLSGGSTTQMELGSISDQVIVGGSATLDGALEVSLADGFMPIVGQTFTLLTANSRNGTFSNEVLPSFSNLTLDVTYDAQNVFVEVVPILPGDFNADGAVNAADYLVWRKGGPNFTQSDYDDWQRNFGRTLPGGGSSSNGFSNVPEPASGLLLSIAIILTASSRFLLNRRGATLRRSEVIRPRYQRTPCCG